MRKSCTRPASGDPLGRHARPPFLKSPTSSFFLASTEITGSPAASAALTLASMKANWVDSSGCRNTAYVTGLEELVQSLGRCPPAKGLSRPAVEGDRHGRGSSGRRNTLGEEVAMTVRKRRSDRSGRGALPSPGRPSVARRE